MSAKITTPFGEAVPPAPRHSVTVHMGGWDTVEKYGSDSGSVIPQFRSAYPRMKPHRDIAQLASAVLEHVSMPETDCLLFSSLQSARECVDYSTNLRRGLGGKKQPAPLGQISVRAFVAKHLFYAVVYPVDYRPTVAAFWSTPGAGVSSRFAEDNLENLDHLSEIPVPPDAADDPSRSAYFNTRPHQVLRERIISWLERAPRLPLPQERPSPQDVYLFPTGMASIYKSHTYMLSHFHGTSVLFGMAFMNTLTALEDFGPGYKFFGHGSAPELALLESYLASERLAGRKVQAIWTEFPSNPLLVTPDIIKLRQLADEYDLVLCIDDTIGSWANLDITAQADILVTSLTKSFNGYADAIAGSAILNPASRHYRTLKHLFGNFYIPELYVADAETIERNSRDYLARTAHLNANAAAIAAYLESETQRPESPVKQVYYPSVNNSRDNYEPFMRQSTDEFTPGFGCLFTVELEDMASTRAFYENLNVHKSVHLGAPFTLAFAYTMCAYKRDLEWAATYGLRPTQIRISAGLEETEVLLEDFKVAVEAAGAARRHR